MYITNILKAGGIDQYFVFSSVLNHVHGEDGGHGIQRSNEDSYLTDPDCQQ